MIYFLTVNYYSTSFIAKLINSIQSSQDFCSQIIVVVNNSVEDSAIRLLKSKSVVLLEPGINLGFGQGCNLGLNWIYRQDSKAIVWLINPDAYLLQSSLKKVNLLFDNYPKLSILGTAIYTPEDKVWFAGGEFVQQTGAILERDLLTNSTKAYINCAWVSGCSFLINLRKFPELPQFDPAYFLYYEDFDFCQRYASLGHTVGITKELSVIHQPSTITNRNKFNKYQYSTYSYLLTLEKYTNKLVLLIRLTRLIVYALLLLLVKPQIAFGKLYGVLVYLRRSLPL
jgi:N-acetylglucosaminyl-diphospho-decaprenol L-rhamnosyltransferase